MDIGAAYHTLRTRWGLGRFLTIVFPALIIMFSVDQSPNFYTKLLNDDSATLFALGTALFLLITVYSSYSKIFKFKVFFMGHLFAGTILLYLYITRFAFINSDSPLTLNNIPQDYRDIAVRVLLLIIAINTLASAFAPSTLRHRSSKLFSLIVVAGEAALFFITLKTMHNFDPESALLLSRDGFTKSILINNTI